MIVGKKLKAVTHPGTKSTQKKNHVYAYIYSDEKKQNRRLWVKETPEISKKKSVCVCVCFFLPESVLFYLPFVIMIVVR